LSESTNKKIKIDRIFTHVEGTDFDSSRRGFFRWSSGRRARQDAKVRNAVGGGRDVMVCLGWIWLWWVVQQQKEKWKAGGFTLGVAGGDSR
jgi:hypothetical protein